MPEFLNIPRKLKDFFEKKQKPQRFTRDNAIEKFKLVAAAGSDGQEPIHSFEEGSTLILSDFPPGTILREKWANTEGSQEKNNYLWWCVGDYDEESRVLEIFDAHGKGLKSSSSAFPAIPFLGVLRRKLTSDKKSGDIPYKIGNQGIITDFCLSQNPRYDKHPFWNKMPETRHTIKVDVIEYGTKEKEKSEVKATKRLGKLKLAPQGASNKNRF